MPTVNRLGTVTIANGQTVSNSVDLGEGALVGIQMPAAFTGVALTLQASHNDSTYVQVTSKDGTAYTITVAASKYITLPPADLAGLRYVKLVSGAAEGGARDIVVMARNV